ncbi:SIMPL domain-containing protein [Mannheimia massilioguelmaensis]|uniref:SIMPL domain-containing protein n=1 Tax=Mannheimia massilioguelmaensis TaxID=1604354 RepID=UPI0005CB5D04|nr:SIMPL domain-containing protein [Mannheimia massilioguelmaensis]
MKSKLLIWSCLFVSVACFAETNNQIDNNLKDVISFSAEVEKEVTRDVLQVSFYLHEEGKSLKDLNIQVAEKLNKALALIKKKNNIEIRSNNRQTQVHYNDKSQKNGWVETAELVVQSKDFDQLSQLIDEVSDFLAINHINAILSKEALADLEDEMVKLALTKFQHKAELIQQSLQAKSYHIVEMNVANVDDRYHAPYGANMMSMRMATAAPESEPVQLESGKTLIKAVVEGKIQLIKE